MQPGHIEVTHSQSEQIGLPNWSFYTIMASAKTSVPHDQYDAAHDYLFLVVDTFIKERVETATRKLMLWANMPTQTLPDGEKQLIRPPAGLQLTSTEISHSIKETVGLPEKAKIDVLGSLKAEAGPGQELVMFDHLAGLLSRQLVAKRDVVLANPRPWTLQQS